MPGDPDLLKSFSPYRKEHIIRLGKYEMNIGDPEKPDDAEWNFGIQYEKSDRAITLDE